MPRELQMNAAPVDAMLECAWFWGINMGAPADQDDDSLIVPCGNQVENQKHCDNLTTAFGGSQNPAPLRQPSDPLPLPEALHITNPANAFYVGTFDFSMSMSPAFGPFSMDVPPKETLAGVGAEELQCQAELLEHSDSGIPDSCGKDVLDKRILDSVSSKGTGACPRPCPDPGLNKVGHSPSLDLDMGSPGCLTTDPSIQPLLLSDTKEYVRSIASAVAS